MAYAILRFAKRKGGAAKAIAAHNERTKEHTPVIRTLTEAAPCRTII